LQVTRRAHTAHSANTSTIRNAIFSLSLSNAKKHGWSMPATIKKASRGIKSKYMAQFFLPFAERKEYLKNPDV
jgi:hypothetical protein